MGNVLETAEVEKLMALPGLGLSHADQCQYGAEAQSGVEQGKPILKPTGFLSNSFKVLDELSRRCEGRNGQCTRSHRTGAATFEKHVSCAGKRARDAQVYTRSL